MKNIALEQKHGIVAAAKLYMQDYQLTNAKLSTLCGVSESYLSNILRGQFEYIPANKTEPVAIPDKYFSMLAETVNYSLKKTYWKHVHTEEFEESIAILTEAKIDQLIRTLVVETGGGKTYTSTQFKRVNPLHTYIISMHSLVNINELFNELAGQMDIPQKGSKGWRRAQILIKLRDLKRQGFYPIVIIDEGENMSYEMMRTIKGFYDGVVGFAAIVLIGTPQLWEVIKEAQLKDKQSGPQFFRRFKAGKREIRVNPNKMVRFTPFFEALGIKDKAFRKLLCETCDNYGELHDFIEPVMRKADEKGMPFNETYFRLYHNMRASDESKVLA